MSANFWCWLPVLGLFPGSPDFLHRVDEFHRPPYPAPAPVMLAFTQALVKRYPDLSAENQNTVWADGPLKGDISGEFIDFGIVWSRYEQTVPFIVATAQSFGLNCFDPQKGRFYPSAP